MSCLFFSYTPLGQTRQSGHVREFPRLMIIMNITSKGYIRVTFRAATKLFGRLTGLAENMNDEL